MKEYKVRDVLVGQYGYEDMKDFSVRMLLSHVDLLPYLRRPRTRSALTPLGTELMAKIVMIPGIAEAYVGRYYVRIVKSPAFNWEEMEPSILEILAL